MYIYVSSYHILTVYTQRCEARKYPDYKKSSGEAL